MKKCLNCLLDREYLEIEDVAKALGISYYTVYRWIQNYQIRAYRIGGSWKIRKNDLLEFLSKSNTFEFSIEELQNLWKPKRYKLKVIKRNFQS